MVCAPGSLSVAVKAWTPLSVAANVYGAGSVAFVPVEVNATVPR